MDTNLSKYVLCIPHGGLNDMLCQIEVCLKYCRRHDRTLILDTFRSGLRDNLLKYFSFLETCKVDVVAWDDVKDTLAGKTTFPEGLQPSLGCYNAENREGFAYLHPETRQKLTFDFTKSYNQDVLIHEACGGGINSYWLLQHLDPTDWMIGKLKGVLAGLPDSFVAVHIRNTDLATDYRTFTNTIQWALSSESVLLCTDSGVVQSEITNDQRFKDSVFALSRLNPSSENRLHDQEATDESANVDLFSDLVAMSLAKNLYFTFTRDGRVSGFSGLAFAASCSIFSRRLADHMGLRKTRSKVRIKALNQRWALYVRHQLILILAKKLIRVALVFRESIIKI